MKYLWYIGIVAAVAYWLWKSNQSPFAGYFATGWGGGNAQANLPAVVNPAVIVGSSPSATPVYGPPAYLSPFSQVGAGSWLH